MDNFHYANTRTNNSNIIQRFSDEKIAWRTITFTRSESTIQIHALFASEKHWIIRITEIQIPKSHTAHAVNLNNRNIEKFHFFVGKWSL